MLNKVQLLLVAAILKKLILII